ncbi:hypothetical protein QU481_21925 [Crenobacter sp. SG2303]|uniref:HNH endonuclease n=1 Tax=Crenobacter oryzisoli TaxID=3056844 RepID=A0ABT7XUM2_9NEIS|nr:MULTISPECIES: hypothetical protein [unclassified Crenobacter]MDN0077486.1 hypothetical protein [Crenobacter sp. SG2303]MDN0083490.1 hypothetical protein [Crenobacter sp. SG2305]
MKHLVITLLFATGLASAGDLPNPHMTPGATNPDVTQDNIQQTVCVKGYTKTIRPAAYYTNKLKKTQISQYGYADTDPKHYEEDHLISLEIGGDPQDERNLWPEPWKSQWNAHVKDKLENKLHKMVCAGEISLAEAQKAMATDWIAAYKHYVVD